MTSTVENTLENLDQLTLQELKELQLKQLKELTQTKRCGYCKAIYPMTQFKTNRNRETKNCKKCRDYQTYRVLNAKTKRCINCANPKCEDVKKEYTSDDFEEKPKNEKVDIPSIVDYIKLKKNELQPLLCRYSKKKILQFFDQTEPELENVLELIENDELKELIKIYMNSIYLESVQ